MGQQQDRAADGTQHLTGRWVRLTAGRGRVRVRGGRGRRGRPAARRAARARPGTRTPPVNATLVPPPGCAAAAMPTIRNRLCAQNHPGRCTPTRRARNPQRLRAASSMRSPSRTATRTRRMSGSTSPNPPSKSEQVPHRVEVGVDDPMARTQARRASGRDRPRSPRNTAMRVSCAASAPQDQPVHPLGMALRVGQGPPAAPGMPGQIHPVQAGAPGERVEGWCVGHGGPFHDGGLPSPEKRGPPWRRFRP
jgi:hypothetical protein